MSKYKNLVIIGNGFDSWLGIPSSYESFRKYYLLHIDKVIEEHGFERVITDDNKTITPVELIYGNPFDPSVLPNEFFWSFEMSLDKIDDQLVAKYCGREKEGVERLRRLVLEATSILKIMFSKWIASLEIPDRQTAFQIPENSFVINFNYTNSLEKCFEVETERICYLHGNATNPESIIFGHTSHPETAFKELKEQSMMTPLSGKSLPRFDQLYAIEDALYMTDKHVEDNIDKMCLAMMNAGVHIEDIENVYVMGHSLADVDMEYFHFLASVTRRGCKFDLLSAAERLDKDLLSCILYESFGTDVLFEEMMLNVEYACHHRERVIDNPEELFPEYEEWDRTHVEPYDKAAAEKAVYQRFLFEQAGRTQNMLKEIANSYGLNDVPEGCHSVLSLATYIDGGHNRRERDAKWHISYHSTKDKKQIKKAIRSINVKNYELFPTIDDVMNKMQGE